MKKIVFIQKQDKSSYDPVNSFFINKKANSMNKPIDNNIKKPTQLSQIQKQLKNKVTKNTKNPPLQTNIGRKGENYTNFKNSNSNLQKKEETIYSFNKDQKKGKISQQKSKNIELDRKVKRIEQIQKQIKQQQSEQIMSKKQIRNVQHDDYQRNITFNENKIIDNKKLNHELQKHVEQLQKREQQYSQMIEQFSAKEEKFIKTEQKLSKLQREHKQCGEKNREFQNIMEKLKEKEAEIKKMMDSKAFPFNIKRQILLINQINQLKRTNRNLVLRIKNYKGTDFVDMAMNNQKSQICREIQCNQNVKTKDMNIEMQSLCNRLMQTLQKYIKQKLNIKKKLQWSQQHQHLINIVDYTEKISLNCLQNYEICPMPTCNEESADIYTLVEQYHLKRYQQPIISKKQLDQYICQQNLKIVNQIKKQDPIKIFIKYQKQTSPKKLNRQAQKYQNIIKIYQHKSNSYLLLLIQSLCEISFIKNWISKHHGQLTQKLTKLNILLQEVKGIVELGDEVAKQSLFLYIESNIQNLLTLPKAIKMTMKQVQMCFKN